MIFLHALGLAIPIIILFFIIIYAHIVIGLFLYNQALSFYDALMNKTTQKSNPFLYGWKYKNRSVLSLFFAFFMLFHLLLFVDFYRSYINDKTSYHGAKLYYVAGMIPHTYNVFLGRLTTPLNPLFLPLNKPANMLKEYLFKTGSQLIPDTDGEKELWEYEWFFYPYAIRFSHMYDTYYSSYGRGDPTSKITKETHNYQYTKLEHLYKIIQVLNEKKLSDPYRDADALKKLPLMVYYYKDKAQFFDKDEAIDVITSKRYIQTKIYDYQNIQLVKWLQHIPDKIDHQKEYQEWGNAHLKELLKVEATRRLVLLDLLERVMFNEIHSSQFHCKNETTQSYVELRNSFMMGGRNSILDALARNGGEKEALQMSKDTKSEGEFFRIVLKKYCSLSVLGKDPYASNFTESLILNPDDESIKKLNEGKINE